MTNDPSYRPWRNLHGAYRTNVRELRRDLTPCERTFWNAVKGRAIEGVKFRRQHPFEGFILDFYAYEVKLVVEIDGDVHDDLEQQRYDAWRESMLRGHGLTVVRVRNEEITVKLSEVLDRLRHVIREAREHGR